MRKFTTFGIVAIALAVGLMWTSEANAQYRAHPGTHAIGAYNRPITPAAVRSVPGVQVYPQFSGYSTNWNYRQYAPFFRTYGYGYGTYPIVYPIQAYQPFYGYGMYYGNGYYYGY